MTWFKRGKGKFGATRTASGFPSKLEEAVFNILCLREKAGEIRNIRRQHSVPVVIEINWKCDFSFEDCKTGETVLAEAKGMVDPRFAMIKRGKIPYRLEIWKGHHLRPHLDEVIETK